MLSCQIDGWVATRDDDSVIDQSVVLKQFHLNRLSDMFGLDGFGRPDDQTVCSNDKVQDVVETRHGSHHGSMADPGHFYPHPISRREVPYQLSFDHLTARDEVE